MKTIFVITSVLRHNMPSTTTEQNARSSFKKRFCDSIDKRRQKLFYRAACIASIAV